MPSPLLRQHQGHRGAVFPVKCRPTLHNNSTRRPGAGPTIGLVGTVDADGMIQARYVSSPLLCRESCDGRIPAAGSLHGRHERGSSHLLFVTVILSREVVRLTASFHAVHRPLRGWPALFRDDIVCTLGRRPWANKGRDSPSPSTACSRRDHSQGEENAFRLLLNLPDREFARFPPRVIMSAAIEAPHADIVPGACIPHHGFTFADAALLAPWFAASASVTSMSSPILKARRGSMHGYDIVDHDQIDPRSAVRTGSPRSSDTLRAHGIGIVLDIVPNHMGIEPTMRGGSMCSNGARRRPTHNIST